MRKLAECILIASVLLCTTALAQTDLAGTWQGKLAASPNEKITIQFIITKQANGSYTAVVNSPDTGGIRNVPATAVKYAGGKLIIDVASLSGSYSGTVGKGTITGEWRQEGSTMPLVLTPYKKPEASSLKPLLGEWVGPLSAPGVDKLAIIFRFEMTPDGKFAAFMDVPDQGARGLPVSDVTLEGGEVRLKVAPARIDYTGKLSGNTINGTFKQGGGEFPLNLTKGKYQPPSINLPPEDMKRLLGQWVGKWKYEGDTVLTVLFRFEKTKEGKFVGTTNSPEQGQEFLPLSDVSLKGDQLNFKIPRSRGEYTGKLDGNSLTGTYKVNGKDYPINLTRGGKYEPPVMQVDIPAETMKKLLGRWNGKLGALSVVFRFERNEAGKNAIYADIPDQGVKAMPVLKASMTQGTLSMNIVGAEYKGKLNGNKIEGSLKPSNQPEIPLNLTKE